MAHNVVAFGEILWDLLPDGPTLGGAPFNFAYRVNSLGDKAYPVSRLGRDELGRDAWRLVESFGIDTSCLQWDDTRPTGTVKVVFDAASNPDYYIVPSVAYDFIESASMLDAVASSADCVCFGTLIQRSPTSRDTLHRLITKAESALKVLDVNLRKDCYTTETIRRSLELVEIVKLNENEAPLVAEMMGLDARRPLPQLARRLVGGWSLECVVVTLGNKGAFAASRQGELVYVPGYLVPVVDTLGSGDAFAAGFIHKLLRGSSLLEACRFGNLLGAVSATKRGGTEPISSEEMSTVRDHSDRIVDPELQSFMTDAKGEVHE